MFTFSQTLLLASANKLTTKSQNHLHIMCFVYLYGKYEKIATIINLIFFVYKSWEEMLITTLQTSTKSERLLNNFHLTHDNRFRSLFCYLVDTLTFIIITVSLYCLSELLCKLLPQSPFSLQTFLSCHNRITTSVTDNIYAGCTPLDLFPVRGKVIHNTAEPSFVTLMTPGLFLLWHCKCNIYHNSPESNVTSSDCWLCPTNSPKP